MVNVTKANFLEESNKLIRELPTAAFVAIDLEMTGISLPIVSNDSTTNGDSEKEDTPESRYESMKLVPERYAIIQVGIAIFHENKTFRKHVIRNTSNLFKYRTEFMDTDGDEEVVGQQQEENREQEQDEIPIVHPTPEEETLDEQESMDTATEPPEFLVSKYNFYLFPPASNQGNLTREPCLNPSSIAFLNEHDMDYNLWIKQGVPYMTLDRAHALMDEFKIKYDKKRAAELEKEANFTPVAQQKPVLEPTRLEDIAFIARTMASLREWIDVPPQPQANMTATTATSTLSHNNNNEETYGVAFTLPQCNAFLRRCLYETISFEYPSLILEKAPLPNINSIRVLRLTVQEKKDRDERLRYQEWAALQNDKIGFTRVFEALSKACRGVLGNMGTLQDEYHRSLNTSSLDAKEKDKEIMFFKENSNHPKVPCRRVPLVVHNGCMDLLFLLTHCHSHALPTSYPQVKECITQYFPVVYDTKVLSSECSDSTIRNDTTALGDLFQRLCLRTHPLLSDRGNQVIGSSAPRVKVVNDSEETANSLALHEAAFDGMLWLSNKTI